MKDYLNTSLESCFSMAGMEVTRTGGYSGWEPNVDSPILKAMKESYKAQFGKEPEVKVIHAGLECGIIGAVVPGLDMISFGPPCVLLIHPTNVVIFLRLPSSMIL